MWECDEFGDLEQVVCEYMKDKTTVTPEEIMNDIGGEEAEEDVYESINEALNKMVKENLIHYDGEYLIWNKALGI